MDDNNKDIIEVNDSKIDNDINTKKSGGKTVRLRLGTLSTLMVVFAVAITIAVNMVVENLDLFYDLTPDQLFSISETSENILDDLDREVTIYTLFRTGHEIGIYQQFLQSYRAFPMVNVMNVDPFIHADFVARHAGPGQTIPVNSIIVESEGRHRVIFPHEMVTTRFDIFTLSEVVESITFESVLTNAIRQVASGFEYKIYFVTGHDEMPLSPAFAREFADWHFTLEELNVTMIDTIPEDASALFITTPQRDWSEFTTQMIWEYLDRGGKAVFFIDVDEVEFDNIRLLMSYFGIDFMNNAILESDPNFLVPFQGGVANPFALRAIEYGHHTITADIIHSDLSIFMLAAMPLRPLGVTRQNLVIEPLLLTSPNSYMKEDFHNFDPETMSWHREADDPTGPFAVSIAITDRNSTPHTRVVFTGTTSVLQDGLNTGANSWLVLNMFSWAMDALPNVWIEAQVVNDSNLEFTNMAQINFIMGISLFIIPGTILATGTVVWLRRRNK